LYSTITLLVAVPASVSNVTSILSPNYYTSGALVSWTNPPFYTKWDYVRVSCLPECSSINVSSKLSSAEVSGLSPGTAYSFGVTAVQDELESPTIWSESQTQGELRSIYVCSLHPPYFMPHILRAFFKRVKLLFHRDILICLSQ